MGDEAKADARVTALLGAMFNNPTGTSSSDVTGSKKHPYGTLDNVPEFATRSLGALYSVVFHRFEYYDGAIVYGPRSAEWPNNGYWGRQMCLHTQEILQLRFWPTDMLQDTDNDPPCIRIATKVSGPEGHSQVAVFTGFQKAAFCNDKDEIRVDCIESSPRIVGCRGLHVFMASLFKRHNTPQTVMSPSTTRSTFDRFGYEALRSTTYSVHKVEKKHLEKTMDHAGACSVTPGSSVLMIAGEIVDVHLEPMGTRVCQPICQKKWRDNAQFIKTEILQNPRGEAAGIQAIGAASCIVDLLSAEGLVGMLAGPFFQGALPDRVTGPHGIPLIISMAVHFAIHWSSYGLPRPSRADMHANDQLRMVLQSSGHGPLPGIEGQHWCIDVVVRGAIHGCGPEVDALKKERGLPISAKVAVLGDQQAFWQRVGQRLVTAFFGLGSVVPRQGSDHGGPGTAWRVCDPLQLARDKWLVTQGCMFEGITDPILPPPACFGARKAAFVKMLTDVETFLRCGQHERMELTPRTAPEESAEHLKQIRGVLQDLMAPKMVQDLVAKLGRKGVAAEVHDPAAKPYDEEFASKMVGHFHLPSMGAAITDCKDALLHGPAQHFKHMTGAYVVAATQTSPCCDCLAPVHVLQGVMLGNTYAECTACHAKRCLPCTEAYAKAVRVQTSQAVGKSCRICGADPAFVSVKRIVSAAGEEMMQIHLGDRTPVEIDGNLVAVAPMRRFNPKAESPTPKGKNNKKKDRAARGLCTQAAWDQMGTEV